MADPISDAYGRVPVNRLSYYGHVVPTLTIPGFEIGRHRSYEENYPLWRTIRDCYAGEARIKAAGEMYLRKLSAHDDKMYESYLSRAYFYNAVRRTHIGLMGSLFRKPPEITVPTNYRLDLSNITLEGESLLSLAKNLGSEVLMTGRYGLLADFREDRVDRPYIAGYEAENIYWWRQTIHQGRKIVDRVILLEDEVTENEYSTTANRIIRVLRLDPDPAKAGQLLYSQTVIRPDSGNVAATPAVEQINVSARGRVLRYIPFVFVNARNLLPECEAPPLYDIASINISHYQSTAHLEHGRFYAGMPTYVTSGDTDDVIPGTDLGSPNPRTVGPSNVWELEKDAKAWLLEFNGHGLVFLENAVDSKQLQMQSLGGRLISSTRRAAAMSDEAWELLETGDEATLLDVAQSCDEGLALAIAYAADIRGDVDDVTKHEVVVEFNKQFVRSELTARELRALQSLAEGGHIPVDVMFYALREVNVVPIEYSLEDFKNLLKREDQIWKDPNPNPKPQPGAPSGRRPPPAPRKPANNGPPKD